MIIFNKKNQVSALIITALLCTVTSLNDSSIMLSSIPANAVSLIGTASLMGQMDGYVYWGDESVDNTGNISVTKADITENGVYTTAWSISGDPATSIEYLILQLDFDNTASSTNDVSIQIDSISIDGNIVTDYQTSANTIVRSSSKDSNTIKLYFTDTWGSTALGKIEDLSSKTTITKEIKVEFEVSSQLNYLYGDLNFDGLVSSVDAVVLLNEIARIGVGNDASFSDLTFQMADVNGDKQLTSEDAFLILTYAAQSGSGETPDPFPIQSN